MRLDKLVEKRTRNGYPPIIVGGLSVRDVLTFGTLDQIKRKVEYCMDTMSPCGGLFLSAYGNKTRTFRTRTTVQHSAMHWSIQLTIALS